MERSKPQYSAVRTRITLYLTPHPIRDHRDPELGKLELTAFVYEDKSEIGSLKDSIETPKEKFTAGAIKWAQGMLATRKLTIDLVCGPATDRAVVEAAGLKYWPELSLRDVP